MFDRLDDLDPTAALARAVDRRRTADHAEAELLAIAAHWADLHPVIDYPDEIRIQGMEGLMPLAGKGTPEVAEFAPAELGAALGISTYAGQQLVGDALELRHRLPRLWARIMNGTLQAWRGRKIAEHTRALSTDAATWVDTQIAPFAHKISLGRTLKLIEAAFLRFDPDQATERAKTAAETRGVWLSDQMTHGTRSIHIETDALDAAAFDHTITQIAHTLAQLGDDTLHDVRRAKAIGVIADPQTALNLLTADDPTGPDTHRDNDTSTRGSQSSTPGTQVRAETDTPTGNTGRGGRPGAHTGKPKVVLYLHLHESAIRTGVGVGRVEGLGPVTIEQIRDWAHRSDLTINRVIDLDDRTSVDACDTTDSKPTAAGPTPCPNPASTSGKHPTAATTSSTTPAPPHSPTPPETFPPGSLPTREPHDAPPCPRLRCFAMPPAAVCRLAPIAVRRHASGRSRPWRALPRVG